MGLSSVFLGTISHRGDTCFTHFTQDQFAYAELRFGDGIR